MTKDPRLTFDQNWSNGRRVKQCEFAIAASLLLLTITAGAQDKVSEEAMKEYFASCAAVQSAVAVKMDSAMAEFIFADARWFVSLVDDDNLVRKQLRLIQKGYNEGDITWQELVDLAQQCSNFKQDILAAQSSD